MTSLKDSTITTLLAKILKNPKSISSSQLVSGRLWLSKRVHEKGQATFFAMQPILSTYLHTISLSTLSLEKYCQEFSQFLLILKKLRFLTQPLFDYFTLVKDFQILRKTPDIVSYALKQWDLVVFSKHSTFLTTEYSNMCKSFFSSLPPSPLRKPLSASSSFQFVDKSQGFSPTPIQSNFFKIVRRFANTFLQPALPRPDLLLKHSETPFNSALTLYHKQLSQLSWLNHSNLLSFLDDSLYHFKFTEKILPFLPDFLNRIPAVVSTVWLLDHINEIEPVLASLFIKNDLNQIKTVVDTFYVLPVAYDKLLTSFSKYLIQSANSTFYTTRSSNMIPILIRNLINSRQLEQECFSLDPFFPSIVSSTYEQICNDPDYQVALLLAKFIHSTLIQFLSQKQNSPNSSPRGSFVSPSELIFNSVQHLLPFIQDKELFLTEYQRLLAKRLIFIKNSRTSQIERRLVSILESILGVFFCSSLNQMINDMDSSTQTFLARQSLLPSKFSTFVLRSNCWPIEKNHLSFSPASEIASIMLIVNEFHSIKDPNKKLFWNPLLSCGSIAPLWKKNCTLLNVNMYALSILFSLSFVSQKVSFITKNLETTNGFDFSVALNSLLQAGIVVRDSFGILLNFDWKPKRRKVRLIYSTRGVAGAHSSIEVIPKTSNLEVSSSATTTSTIPSSSSGSNSLNHVNNPLAQALMIKAAIVRLLKRNKEMIFRDICETLAKSTTRFSPNPNQIRRGIDSCLAQGFIIRSTSDQRKFIYNP